MIATAHLNDTQLEIMGRTIEGREVHDFGCGTGVFTRTLEAFGPKRVVGIDKERLAIELASKHLSTADVSFVCANFDAYLRDAPLAFDVGLISWPQNCRSPALVQLIQRCKTVIYIGKNTDLTACGGPDLFEYLARCRIVEYVPAFRNTLIVYAEKLSVQRPLRGEEFAALTQYHGTTWPSQQGMVPAYTFEEAELLTAEMDRFATRFC